MSNMKKKIILDNKGRYVWKIKILAKSVDLILQPYAFPQEKRKSTDIYNRAINYKINYTDQKIS